MSIDTSLFYKVNHLVHNKVTDAVAIFIHYVTYNVLIFLVPICFLFFSENPAKKLFAKQLLLAMILAGVINDFILQPFFRRARPFSVLENVVTLGKLPSEYSFPSGHTAVAFAFASVYFLVMPKGFASYGIVLFASVVAFGRIYMGFHYPMDVIAGVIVGVVCAFLSIAILKSLT